MAYGDDMIGNRVKLGMAKNMAFEMTKASGVKDASVFEEAYKEWARFFVRVNDDIDREHGVMPATPPAIPSAAKPAYPPGTGKKVGCPKCGESIPAGFKFHAACGWSSSA